MPVRRKSSRASGEARIDLRVSRDVYPRLFEWIETTQNPAAAIRVALEAALTSQGGGAAILPSQGGRVAAPSPKAVEQPDAGGASVPSAVASEDANRLIMQRLLSNSDGDA